MEPLSVEIDEILSQCRLASSKEEQDRTWKTLVEFVKGLDSVPPHVSRQVLLEWPHDSLHSTHIEAFFSSCGLVTTITACTKLLKDLSSTTSTIQTNLSRSTILTSCWKILRFMILTPRQGDETPIDIRANSPQEMERLIKSILLLPQLVANACHSCSLQLPKMAVSAEFFTQLLTSCWVSESRVQNVAYFEGLLHVLLSGRQATCVARALESHHPLPPFIFNDTWTPRELVNLLHCLLCLLDPEASDSNTIDEEFKENTIRSCVSLLSNASTEVQEAFVHQMIFSANTSLNPLLCTALVRVLKESNILYESLLEVCKSWSQWSFCQEFPVDHQHFISNFILGGLEAAPWKNDAAEVTELVADPLILALLHGVPFRLESGVLMIRLDGMRIARSVAQTLNQDIEFEELDENERQMREAIKALEGENNQESKSATTKSPLLQASDNTARKIRRQAKLDPDELYDSDCSADAHGWDEDGFDSDVEDELVPYSSKDEELDLVETKVPLHLVDAIEVLRTKAEDIEPVDLERAMKSLPDLIRKQPDDLPDVAVSLLLETLRLDNFFGIPNFLEYRQGIMTALTVEEPFLTGQELVEQIFQEGVLTDRLLCLAVMQDVARILSGKADGESKKDSGDKTDAVKALSWEKGATSSSISTRTKRRRLPKFGTIKNRFTPVAPTWFYSLIAGMSKKKDNEPIFSGSSGSHLLVAIIKTLTLIVNSAGMTCTAVMTRDLFEFVWTFRDADIAEVRHAVLVSTAMALQLLPRDQLFELLHFRGEKLRRDLHGIALTDSDQDCCRIAGSVLRSIPMLDSEDMLLNF